VHTRGFVPRVLIYHASRDLVPLYSVYALLFSDHGVSGSHVSLLFVIWSVTSFVCEVPSGAWADTFDRRHLLVVSAVVYAAAFASWLVWPTFAGFALGFVLWGLSSALMSGTFESLLYDELVDRGRESSYPTLIGWAHSTALLAILAASGLAVWLYDVGGYALVGWTSVAIAVGQAGLAATLPVSRHARRPNAVDNTDPVAETERVFARYGEMLRSGLSESRHQPLVRRALLLAAAMVGFTTYDEYFPLVARAHGVATATVPVLVAVTVVGQAAGTALAGVSYRLSRRQLAVLMTVGAVLVAIGALVSPYVGFVAIAVGYGLLNNTMLVGEARLQSLITGPARATVTSVLGLLEEVVAVAVYLAFALASDALGFPRLVALLGVPVVAVAVCVARWLPDGEFAQRPMESTPDAD
jgi:MFS family permease